MGQKDNAIASKEAEKSAIKDQLLQLQKDNQALQDRLSATVNSVDTKVKDAQQPLNEKIIALQKQLSDLQAQNSDLIKSSQEAEKLRGQNKNNEKLAIQKDETINALQQKIKMIQDEAAKQLELVSDKFRLQHASQEEKLHTFQQSGSNDKHAIEVQAKTIQDLNFEKAALSRQLDEANKEQSKMSAEMDQLRVEAKNGENLPELISQATADKEKEISGLTAKISEYENKLGEKDGVINTLHDQQSQDNNWKRRAQQDEDNLIKIKEELNQLRQLATAS